PIRVNEGELRITFVNHATVLVQMDGLNVLTDPIWGDVAGPVPYLARKRRRPPGIRFEDLPPIDAVLLSHDHYDHLDVPTLQRIVRAHRPRILAGLGMAALLATVDIAGVTELDWWQWTQLAPGLRAWGVPARHGCRRASASRSISGPSPRATRATATRNESCTRRSLRRTAPASSCSTTARPSPAHQRREAHEDRLGVAAALEAEQRAAVVDEVEFDVAAAPAQLCGAILLGPGNAAAPLDQRHVRGQEGLADASHEGPVLRTAQVVEEDAA